MALDQSFQGSVGGDIGEQTPAINLRIASTGPWPITAMQQIAARLKLARRFGVQIGMSRPAPVARKLSWNPM